MNPPGRKFRARFGRIDQLARQQAIVAARFAEIHRARAALLCRADHAPIIRQCAPLPRELDVEVRGRIGFEDSPPADHHALPHHGDLGVQRRARRRVDPEPLFAAAVYAVLSVTY